MEMVSKIALKFWRSEQLPEKLRIEGGHNNTHTEEDTPPNGCWV
jgi:hypothetical protein